MKKGIHPDYQYVIVTCANCGAQFKIGTTKKSNFSVPICSKCHPVYTGKELSLSKVDQVAKFMERMKKAEALKKARAKKVN